MKAFNIKIEKIKKGPDELKYQLPVEARVLKQVPGKDRPDYWLAKLEKPVFWVDKEKDINGDVTHIVICSKYKGQKVSEEMKGLTIAIAYVIDESLLKEPVLDLKKCAYVAVGEASAKGKWKLFG